MKPSFIVTNARINKGYGNNPAISFSESGKFCHFQIGFSVYDTTDKKTKWINLPCRAFNSRGKLVERIQQQGWGEGTTVNLHLEVDSNEFTGKDNKKKTEVVFNVLDFDYPIPNKPKENQQNGYPNQGQVQQNGYQMPPAQNVGYPNPQGQYTGQPMGQANGYPNGGYPNNNPQFPNANPNQAAMPVQGSFTVLPEAPVAPPNNANPYVTAVPNGNFTGFENAGSAMGIPNDGSGFMGGGFSEG